jgi:hypothetical protein
MRSPFDPEELRRLNQTPTERLLDWSEEKFKRHDYGPKRGRPVGYQLMSENEDDLFTFTQKLTPEDIQEIRAKLRILEGQCHLLELVLEMLEPGHETLNQTKERMTEKKRSQDERRKDKHNI